MSVWRPLIIATGLVGLAAMGPALASDKLSAKGTCVACHLVNKKLVGPSWHDVAVKYKNKADAPALMFERVRKGGKGVWGAIPMAPTTPDKLSDADLKAVIAWILQAR